MSCLFLLKEEAEAGNLVQQRERRYRYGIVLVNDASNVVVDRVEEGVELRSFDEEVELVLEDVLQILRGIDVYVVGASRE